MNQCIMEILQPNSALDPTSLKIVSLSESDGIEGFFSLPIALPALLWEQLTFIPDFNYQIL